MPETHRGQQLVVSVTEKLSDMIEGVGETWVATAIVMPGFNGWPASYLGTGRSQEEAGQSALRRAREDIDRRAAK